MPSCDGCPRPARPLHQTSSGWRRDGGPFEAGHKFRQLIRTTDRRRAADSKKFRNTAPTTASGFAGIGGIEWGYDQGTNAGILGDVVVGRSCTTCAELLDQVHDEARNPPLPTSVQGFETPLNQLIEDTVTGLSCDNCDGAVGEAACEASVLQAIQDLLP